MTSPAEPAVTVAPLRAGMRRRFRAMIEPIGSACKEANASAICTDYMRADLPPAAEAEKVRVLLRNCLDQRTALHSTRDAQEVREINVRTAQLRAELW